MDKPVTDLALVRACESRIVNAWPAPTTLVIDDWVVRFANGYSGRANSASALQADAEMDDDTLAFIEKLYAEAGLPPRIRFTPLVAESARQRFAARGYRIETASFGMVAELDPNRHPQYPEMFVEPLAARASGRVRVRPCSSPCGRAPVSAITAVRGRLGGWGSAEGCIRPTG